MDEAYMRSYAHPKKCDQKSTEYSILLYLEFMNYEKIWTAYRCEV